jgi:nickel-dependent lactate racemase
VTAAAHIVKPGGAILLVAECAEGAGAAEFSRLLLESPSPAAFLEKIEHGSVEVDQWQLEKLALVVLSHRVLFYVPGLPAEFRAKLWGPAFSSAPESVAALISMLPDAARVAVLPEGPYVFARPTAPAAEPVAD